MDVKHIQPSENYEELKTQFLALKRLLQSKDVEVEVYRNRIKEFNLERVIVL